MEKDQIKSPKGFKRFTISYYSFLIFTTLPGFFINTFLLEKADLPVVLMYNIIVFVSTAFFMHISTYWVKFLKLNGIIIIGILMYIFAYLVMLILMNDVGEIYVLVALIMGCAAGFFWLGYNTFVNMLTIDQTRDKSLGILNIGVGVANMIIPLFSGYLISKYKDTGYVIIFSSACVIAVLTIFLFSTVPYDKSNEISKKSSMIKAYKRIFTEKIWQICFLGEVSKGIRDGAMTFLLPVALFLLVKNEFLVGMNSFGTWGAAILSSLIIGKIVMPHNRIKSMIYSSSILLVLSAILVFFPYPHVVVIFSIANSFIQYFFVTPSLSIMFMVFEFSPDDLEIRSELFAIREVALGIGRGIGIAIFLFLPSTTTAIAFGILIITAIQYITIFLNSISIKQIRNAKKGIR